MLEVNNIEVVYDKLSLIIQGISFKVPEKSIVAFLGANGAGKTTTLKAISGALQLERGEVSDGTITFKGKEIQNRAPYKIAKMGITMVPENRGIFDDLTVEENLNVGAFRKKMSRSSLKRNYEKVYELFPSLVSHRKRLGRVLSGGEQQMLAIGRALMAEPKVMLLDEPSLGLSPLLVKEVFEAIKKINADDGVTILLVEQNAVKAFDLSQYVYIMENGKIVIDGTPDKLSKNEDVMVFYLGNSCEENTTQSFHDVKHYKRRKRWLS